MWLVYLRFDDQKQVKTYHVTAVQKYIFTRTDFYRDFTNEPEVKSFLVNELFRYDYDG